MGKRENTNGIYRVAKFFDDIFSGYTTCNISKKEARSKALELNKARKGYITSYRIVDITNKLLKEGK